MAESRKANLKKIIKNVDSKVFGGLIPKFKNKVIGDKLAGISLDVSGKCNLKCEMCSLEKYYKDKGVMTMETFNCLRSAFSKFSAVELQCNAEPLLNPNTVAIAQAIKEENPAINLSFVTNGTLLTENIINSLLRAKINKIRVSVDGSSDTLYESIRKGSNYKIVMANIAKMVALRNKGDYKTEIGIITVATKHNIDDLVNILDLAHNLGTDSFTVNGLEPYNEQMKDSVLYNNGDPDSAVREVFNKVKEKAAIYNMALSLPGLQIMPYDNCILNSCLIHANGDVSPCASLSYQRPYYYFNELLQHPRISFGNINNESIFDIWNKTEYKKFRRQLRDGDFPVYCRKCLFKNGVICPLG